MKHSQRQEYVAWLQEIGSQDVSRVGGKNAALGEMLQKLESGGVRVPHGFVVTSAAYWEFLRRNCLIEELEELIADFQKGLRSLEDTGQRIRQGILQARFPEDIQEAITEAYRQLSGLYGTKDLDVAVRSSATAEDLPRASFAGLYDSRLNVSGPQNLLAACQQCFASLFTDRAISYRQGKQFDHLQVAQCVGIQKMVRSDLAGAGVLFTADQESGFHEFMVLTAAWGLGENVVQGGVNPDVILLFKPFLSREDCSPILESTLGYKEKTALYAESGQGVVNVETEREKRRAFVLSPEESVQLGLWGRAVEDLFGRAMDIEWAKDGTSGELYLVQARPIVKPSAGSEDSVELLRLLEPGQRLLSGTSVGQGVVQGKICLLADADDIHSISGCPIIVSETANTAWLPSMQKQGIQGLITDFGGKNSHAATLSRELGIPAVLGTLEATARLSPEQEVTLFASQGDYGHVYAGKPAFESRTVSLGNLPKTRCGFWLSVETPENMLHWWRMPRQGMGLVSLEFILKQRIAIHPLALLHLDQVASRATRLQIETYSKGFAHPADYFRTLLRSSVAKIAAVAYPQPAIVRLNDLRTEELAELKGGDIFEAELPEGCRGVARYLHPAYQEAFELELDSLRSVREQLGFTNLELMIPHCRDPQEADRLIEVLQQHGFASEREGAQMHLSLDYEANLDQLDAFASRFQGLSLDLEGLQSWMASSQEEQKGSRGSTEAWEERLAAPAREVLQAGEQHGLSVGLRADKAERMEGILPHLIPAGLSKITLPPEEVPLVKQWVRKLEKGS